MDRFPEEKMKYYGENNMKKLLEIITLCVCVRVYACGCVCLYVCICFNMFPLVNLQIHLFLSI